MIIQSEKLIFVHIPKTGGTSIEYALYPHQLNPYVFRPDIMFGLVDNQYSQHFNYVNIKKYSNQNLDSYFKFAVVRNTWDRLFSAYKYITKIHSMQNFEDVLRIKCDRLKKGFLNQTDHFNSQMVFIKDLSDNINIDFIGRFESLQSDFDNVCETNHIHKKQLDKINCSFNVESYMSYYNDRTIKLVNDTYAEEIEFFNFQFQ